jgi:hypothetical protein
VEGIWDACPYVRVDTGLVERRLPVGHVVKGFGKVDDNAAVNVLWLQRPLSVVFVWPPRQGLAVRSRDESPAIVNEIVLLKIVVKLLPLGCQLFDMRLGILAESHRVTGQLRYLSLARVAGNCNEMLYSAVGSTVMIGVVRPDLELVANYDVLVVVRVVFIYRLRLRYSIGTWILERRWGRVNRVDSPQRLVLSDSVLRVNAVQTDTKHQDKQSFCSVERKPKQRKISLYSTGQRKQLAKKPIEVK